MGDSRSVIDASSPKLPRSTTSTAIGTSGTATTIAFTSADVGGFFTLRADSAFTLRAAAVTSSLAATAADLPHSADTHYAYKVTQDTRALSVYMAATGTLYWARSS